MIQKYKKISVPSTAFKDWTEKELNNKNTNIKKGAFWGFSPPKPTINHHWKNLGIESSGF